MATSSMGKTVHLTRDMLRKMYGSIRRVEERAEPDKAVTFGVPSLGAFDAEQVRDALVDGIRDEFRKKGFYRAVVGISGGKDSTVVAALCARALGPSNVLGVLMPDGEQVDIDDSREVVESLGIPSITANVGATHRALRRAVSTNDLRAAGFAPARGQIGAADLNVAPRLRMTILRFACQASGALLAGTGNLSEATVGYFTKDGDSSCDVAVLAGLTSVEVVEVGKTLDEVPRHLVKKPPADGLTGKTDEEVLGVSYVDIHNWIRRGTSGDARVDERIESLSKASEHKRERAKAVVA